MGHEQSQLIFNNNNNNQNQINSFPQINLSKSLFEFLYVIGRGGFGKVWKVNLKKTQKCYALKEMSKLKIILRRSEKSIRSERELLSNLYHPFLVNMICAFQDFDNLYLVMDLFKGGDLRYHIFMNKKFSESQSKFFCANVILGLEYIHKNNIIHRDIKPENLVLDSNGYLAITDFGVATKNNKNNSSETSGTPGYMAPEVLCSLNHSFFVDFYAVGVMAYEFMNGHRPYLGRNRKEIKEAVLAKQVIVSKKNLGENGWSFEAGDFINRMIQRKVMKRLGYNGIIEIKNHFWFKEIDWDELLLKKIKSPFIPKDEDNFDKKFCEASDNFGEIDGTIKEKYNIFVKRKEFRNLFYNYTYIREEEKQQVINNYYNDNNNNNNQLRKSYVKIIQVDKKYPLRINNNISTHLNILNNNINNNINNNYQNVNNDNNNNILNNSRINFNIKPESFINQSKSSNNIFISPKNNGQVFYKKRATKNSIIIDKNPNNEINNHIENNNQKYRNSVIIINPYYNQNINYFSNSNLNINEPLTSKNMKNNNIFIQNDMINSKTKSFDLGESNEFNNRNSNTLDMQNRNNIRIKVKNNNINVTRKNSNSLSQPSYSLKVIRKNPQQININTSNQNQINKNLLKERIVYSPPHVISAKINIKNKSQNKLNTPTSHLNINNINDSNSNSKIYEITRNNGVKRMNCLNENNNVNNISNILINNKENYSTLDYTLDRNSIISSYQSLPFSSNTFKNSINKINFRNNVNRINSEKFIHQNKNNSTLNIHEKRYINNNRNEKNLYSTINKFLYKKNNATISYSSTSKSMKKISLRPTCLYNNSKVMKEKLYNNSNFDYLTFNKIKGQSSIRIDNFINTLNNSNHKPNDINKKNNIKINRNIFNKRKSTKNINDKNNNLNNYNKNNRTIHSKLWPTSENNVEKKCFEQSFSSTIRNDKENINNNYSTNTNTNTINNNIAQIRVTLIPRPQIKTMKKNI